MKLLHDCRFTQLFADRRLLVQKASHCLLVAVIAFYCFESFLQTFPDSGLYRRLYTPVSPLFSFFGLYQAFAVFAPTVTNFNQHIRAVVTMSDGNFALVDFPQMENLTPKEKMRQEGFRKWSHDNFFGNNSYLLYPDAARYVARGLAAAPLTPEYVSLTQFFKMIPSPQVDPEYPKGWSPRNFFVYKVQPEDLK
jgi:hypothetical protein